MSSEKSLEIVRDPQTNGGLCGRWSQTALIDHPPKPRLALTIGVTGHRLHRAPPLAGRGEANARVFDIEAVEQGIGDFFRTTIATFASVKDEVSQSFDSAAPAFTLISSLAEGADRIAARAALAAGFALDVVLPCPPSIYRRDFRRRRFARRIRRSDGVGAGSPRSPAGRQAREGDRGPPAAIL